MIGNLARRTFCVGMPPRLLDEPTYRVDQTDLPYCRDVPHHFIDPHLAIHPTHLFISDIA
ncbi:hypothetical protein [Mesorhizobium dulcispinae]|uniref:hypothetical protein n=1 Tax=Mesorhizobium dulcispinae TaxID=3072316 RepID=UPI002A23C3E5|nr:hypothetical protein [Mesorhizobium sp. VK23D]